MRPSEHRQLDLSRLFRPHSVAVVGASDSEGSQAAMNLRLLRGWLPQAAIHPVNPNREAVDGLPCHRSVLDVPEDVDVAVLLVGADATVPAVRECVEAKVPFVVVFASGFAEAGPEGRARQAELEAAVRDTDTRLLGPNTALNVFQPFRRDLPGPRLALVTQSGQQGRPIYQAQEIGVPLEGWAATGNEADLEAADFIRHFAGLDDVGAVACYIEGFRDGRALQLALDETARRGTPVVMVKVGRSEVGRSWARSHTGHLAGSDAVVSGVLRQYGVHRVDDLDELLDTSVLLARAGPPRAGGIGIYALSGGAGAHVSDLVAAAGLPVPELSAETQAALRATLPGFLRVSNPVDCGGYPSREHLEALLDDPRIGLLLVPIAGHFPGLSDRLAEDLVAVAGRTDKPVCVVWGSPVADEAPYRDTLLGCHRIITFRSARNAVGAIRAWADHHQFVRRYRSAFGGRAPRPVRASVPSGTLSEHRSKELLRAWGIATTRDELCASAAEAVRAAERIGFPVVVKACGGDLAHKTEAGAVRVGVGTPRALREAFAELRDLGDEGVLVCEQLTGGVECVVGVARDELFGPVVMFGIGGVAVEVYRDVTFRVPPFGRQEARRMIGEVRGLPLLRGHRGGPKADLGALADVVVRVQRMALEAGDALAELDINPLLALPDRAVALDALVVGR